MRIYTGRSRTVLVALSKRVVFAALALLLGVTWMVGRPGDNSGASSGATQLVAAVNPMSAGTVVTKYYAVKRGNLWINHSQTLSHLHVTGSVFITGSNVRLSSVKVDGSIFVNQGPSGQLVNPVPRGITLLHVSATSVYSYGFNGLTLSSVDLSHARNGSDAQLFNYASKNVSYPATGLRIENSWFHGQLASTRSAGLDNLHLGGVQHAFINNNRFDMIAPDARTLANVTSNVQLEPTMYGAANSDITFTNNVLHGGGYYQLYFTAAGTNLVSNNQFNSDGRHFTAVQFPPSGYASPQNRPSPYNPFREAGNRLNGHPITLPGSHWHQPSPSPVSSSPSPVSSSPSPAPVTTSPAPVSSSPSPAPVTTSPAPVSSTPTPSPVSSSPSPAPVTTSPAPVSSFPTVPSPLSAGIDPNVPLSLHQGDLWVSSTANVTNMHITGSLYISGSNVNITNVQVDGTIFINYSPSGMIFSPVPTNVNLTHITGFNMFSNGFQNLTLNGVDLANAQNGPHAQLFNYSQNGVTYPAINLIIENSWFHGLQASTNGAHIENLHLGGVQGALITNNEFDMIAPDANTLQYITANVTLEPAMYGVFNTNIVFTNNVIRGGGYFQLYFDAAGASSVQNNQFYAGGNPRLAGVQYPPSAYPTNQLPSGRYISFTQLNNTLEGAQISLPGGK